MRRVAKPSESGRFGLTTLDGLLDPPAQPTVGVVIPTRDRPQLVRRAIDSVIDQDYDGVIDVLVVYDHADPEQDLVRTLPGRTVRVVRNARTPGLAGARNTGILALQTDVVAFCDDDDQWLQGKLRTQVDRLVDTPDCSMVTTAMRVDIGSRSTVRLAGKELVTLRDLVRSRMAMLHSSSFLFRRNSMIDGFGLVDETLPRSMAEDWDLLIRAARMAPIAHVDDALVGVLWSAGSYFNEAWREKNGAHEWLLAHHPELTADRIGRGHLLGKLAFGHAALGHRKLAIQYAIRASISNWREPRGLISLLVVCGAPADRIQLALNRRGHGI